MDKPSKGLPETTFHPSPPRSPRTAARPGSEGWNFKLTQIFQSVSSVFQQTFMLAEAMFSFYCCYEIQHFSRNNF